MVNNYEEIEYTQADKLNALRQFVKLNPLDFMRVRRARKQAEAFRELYIRENPSDIIGVDYSVADDLEYQLRLAGLERDMEKSWRAYLSMENDGYGLRDFAEDFLKQYINEHKETEEVIRAGRGM